MHYRSLSIFISALLFLLLLLSGTWPNSWMIGISVALTPVLIIVLVVGILRSPDVGSDPPARNKWYHF